MASNELSMLKLTLIFVDTQFLESQLSPTASSI
jgi:hypothetical protein